MNKPNILIFMFDQFQGRILQDKALIAPNLKKMQNEGMSFNRAYTPNPVCSPARASLMTGLLPHNHGVLYVNHMVDSDQSNLRTEHPHFAQRLKENGYNTAYFGRWHVDRYNMPKDLGWEVQKLHSHEFSFNQISEDELIDIADNKTFIERRKIKGAEGYAESDFMGTIEENIEERPAGVTVAAAVEYLKNIDNKKPWCTYIGVNEPHDPYICGKAAFDLYENSNIELPPNAEDNMEDKPGLYRKAAGIFSELSREDKIFAKRCYLALITELDTQIGRIIDCLEETGQIDNTVIIITSDHGDYMSAHGLFCKNISAFDECYSIPMILRGPGISKGVAANARVGLHDLCKTILEITGSRQIENQDSKSFAEVLSFPEREDKYTEGYAEYHGGRMIITQRVLWKGDYKLAFNWFDFDELYDLKNDRYELCNLAQNPEYAEVLKDMTKTAWEYIKKTNDHCLLNAKYPILRLAPFGPNI